MRRTLTRRWFFAAAFSLLTLLAFPPRTFPQSEAGPIPAAKDQQPGQGGHVVFTDAQTKEQVIGELSPGSDFVTARSTENHLAWIEKAGGKKTVWLDGKKIGDTYDDIKYLTFSEDEQHTAFTAKRNSRWVLVVDGANHSREYGLLTAPVLSGNGKFYAVGACIEKKCRLVVNEEELGSEYEEISMPRFNKDGSHYVYFGKRKKKWIQVMDGKEQGAEMDDFAFWFFTPDGETTAVAARLKSDWTWIVRGVPGPAFDVLGLINFSDDGKHFAYGGTDAKYGFSKNKTHGLITVDGQNFATFEGKGFGGGWQGLFGVNQQIVTGPHVLRPDFHGVSDPRYTKEGKLIYAGRSGEGHVNVFVDGAPGPDFEDIVSPIGTSSDGKHIAYLGKQGDSFVEVRDQKPGASFPGKRELSLVELLTINDDGSHLAYEIVRGGNQFKQGTTTRALRRMVVDGQAGPEFDALDIDHFWFSADGSHHSYEVIGAAGDRDRVVFDGVETKLYDSVFRNSTKRVDETTIEFVARDGRRFLRVLQNLKP